jgi:hypothetical protein
MNERSSARALALLCALVEQAAERCQRHSPSAFTRDTDLESFATP